jgi:hypothetical protein
MDRGLEMSLQIAAAFQGFHHGEFIGVFEVGAGGDADVDLSPALDD